MKPKYSDEYWKRIYLVQDYIEKHPTEIFTVENLAQISGLSQYHFHRIFKALTQETIYEFVTRTNMEWALGMLLHRQDLSITDIAYELGYSDSAVFSRSFKRYYDMSPRKIRSEDSKNRKVIVKPRIYNEGVDEVEVKPILIEHKIIKPLKLIYQRKIGSYSQLESYGDVIQHLFSIALNGNILNENSKPVTIYHSSPEISETENQRTTFGLFVKETTKGVPRDDVSVMTLDESEYAVLSFELDLDEYPAAWNYIYESWLGESGYLPRNAPPFEVYKNNPLEHPLGKHLVDIYIPVTTY
ncbi:AraC family transcriptional regulator [Erysipelothrix inopinata]|uniref:AraC family transcriptional regulator n=1 Tax=Erysipelothrix inopinata TaxID=225084 RepID=A0A7G9RX45_9FIRM|nr:GyrI-like domain-containing protein [Erysipelothrix inopinata]QNN60170.1 AraC family transcriptional regulator [Erysipelothrix inopinata]